MTYERFKWKTNGKADSGNITVSGNARFTVLTDRLIRMEYDPEGVFTDNASQFAFFRNFPKTEYSLEETDRTLTIETGYIKLEYVKGLPFGADSISVSLKRFPAEWHWDNTAEQLKGTACTLDNINGEIELEDGVCSRNGYTVVDDSSTCLLSENGWFETRKSEQTDIYFFGYGHDYFDCIADYYRLTGVPPVLPNYAFGNWWSRYYAYSQQEYCELMDRFSKENIPFSVSVVDMDWHTTETPKESQIDHPRFWNGWTGYSWNRELFPDYRAFLAYLKDKGLRTALNLHPSNGVGFQEDMYGEMAKAMGVDPSTKKLIKFDVLNPDFMEKYFDILHHPYEKDGVDFWWMDWQQGTDYWWVHDDEHPVSELEGITPLWLLNHLHILDIERDGKRPMFFSRYCGLGAHRYPVGFSGDTITTWESLDFQPYFTANATNAGYCWWSHDIGGHMQGYRDDQLQVRWLQLGVFSPINRLHSTNDMFAGKEPWNLSEPCCSVYKNWLRFRHRLFPYLYTMNYRTGNELKPLVTPMYYHYPEIDNAYRYRNQYFFGSQLMVAPITSPDDKCAMLGSVEVWLPKGLWFDFFSGFCYNGDKVLKVHRKLEDYPVFAKAGAIVPLMSKVSDNRLCNSEDMTVCVFPGADNKFELYEDSGDGKDYRNGEFVKTLLELDWGKTAHFTVNPAKGKTGLIPDNRNWRIVLKGVNADVAVKAFVDGKEICAEICRDGNTNSAEIIINNISVSSKIEIEAVSETSLITDNRSAKDKARDIILHSQAPYNVKSILWDIFNKDGYVNSACSQKEYAELLSAVKEMKNL